MHKSTLPPLRGTRNQIRNLNQTRNKITILNQNKNDKCINLEIQVKAFDKCQENLKN